MRHVNLPFVYITIFIRFYFYRKEIKEINNEVNYIFIYLYILYIYLNSSYWEKVDVLKFFMFKTFAPR